MAVRTLEEIIQVIKTKARTFPSLDVFLFKDDPGALTGSAWISAVETVAEAQQVFEVVAETEKAAIQAVADSAPSGNAAWIRARILEFQFGDVVTIDPNTFVVSYPVVDTTKQIVSRCAVTPTAGNIVQIKVAKGDNPPEPLTPTELEALQDYYFGTGDTQGIGFAGVNAVFVNQDPDRIYVEGVIRYLGQFTAATVKANVIAAIEAFFDSFQDENFNGVIKMQKLEDAILAVEGVSRFEFATNGIRARDFNTAFGSATVISPDGFYEAVAGYVIGEDTVGETLDDRITTALETV